MKKEEIKNEEDIGKKELELGCGEIGNDMNLELKRNKLENKKNKIEREKQKLEESKNNLENQQKKEFMYIEHLENELNNNKKKYTRKNKVNRIKKK